MLHRLEIENFYSIREKQIIDLRAAANAPDDPARLVPIWPGAAERVPKVLALFGANASGKSNILKAISFLVWFAKDSFRAVPNAWMPYQRFNDEEMQGLPTRLSASFAGPADLGNPNADGLQQQCRFAYEVTLGGERGKPQQVLNETLKYWPPNAGKQVRLFERDEHNVVKAGKAFGISGYQKALEKILRPNASVISTLNQLGHPIAALMVNAASNVDSNILIEKHEINDDILARYYLENPQFLNLLNQNIERIDLGVRKVEIQASSNGPIVSFLHEGLSSPLYSQLESHGTRMFIKIFPYLTRALMNGGVALIDELDLAIHPLILPEIIRWFHDPERNPNNAQLWMSCQNASLLEELIKEEVLFCEKDSRGRTTVYSLRDVQGVRRGDNYYRRYLGGTYGAVPRLG